jgi:hypothetical protein
VHVSALYEAGGGKFEERDQGAIDAREAGLARFPSDRNAPAMRASLALQHAVRGDIVRARELLSHFERNLAGEYYQHTGDLAQTLAAAAEGREPEAAKLAKSVFGYMNQYPKDASLQGIRMRAEKALVRYLPWTKSKVGRLRSQWKLAKPAGGTSLRPSYLPTVPAGIFIMVLLAILRSCGHG